MLECVDRHHKYLLLEDIYLLGPALDVLIIVPNTLTGKLNQEGHILLSDHLVLQDFRNQFFQKEGRVDMRALLHLWREEDELHQLDVVGDYGIV